MTTEQMIYHKRAYIKQLYNAMNSSSSMFFKECMIACIENEINSLNKIKQRLSHTHVD